MFLTKALEEHTAYRPAEDKSQQVCEFDAIFENEIEDQIGKVKKAYDLLVYRDVVKFGLHEFVGKRDMYLLYCGKAKPRFDLIERYAYLQLLFLYPICPHFCEVSYIDYFLPMVVTPGKYPKLLGFCSFPQPLREIDYSTIRSHQYITKFLLNARDLLKKSSRGKKGQVKFSKATVIYREKFQDFQLAMLKLLKSCVKEGAINPDWRNEVKIDGKDEKTKALRFGGFIAEEYKTYGEHALDEALIFDERKSL
jgi:leucyl-tRNA synthetase